MNETFQKLWFTPTPAHDKETMTRKILNITDVVSLTSLTYCLVLLSAASLLLKPFLVFVLCSPSRSQPAETLAMTGSSSFYKTWALHLVFPLVSRLSLFLFCFLTSTDSSASQIWRGCILQTSQKGLRSAGGQSSGAHPQIRGVSCRYASSLCSIIFYTYCILRLVKLFCRLCNSS